METDPEERPAPGALSLPAELRELWVELHLRRGSPVHVALKRLAWEHCSGTYSRPLAWLTYLPIAALIRVSLPISAAVSISGGRDGTASLVLPYWLLLIVRGLLLLAEIDQQEHLRWMIRGRVLSIAPPGSDALASPLAVDVSSPSPLSLRALLDTSGVLAEEGREEEASLLRATRGIDGSVVGLADSSADVVWQVSMEEGAAQTAKRWLEGGLSGDKELAETLSKLSEYGISLSGAFETTSGGLQGSCSVASASDWGAQLARLVRSLWSAIRAPAEPTLEAP